jgi:hypothetical protein
VPLFGKKVTGLAGVILALSMGNAYAFGNAGKNVNFSVDNEFTRGAVVVTSFDLWSESEGRWLKEDFHNVDVPVGAKDFVVRKGEDVEYAENDRITKIRVNFRVGFSGPDLVSIDTSIDDPICVAGRWYKATISD